MADSGERLSRRRLVRTAGILLVGLAAAAVAYPGVTSSSDEPRIWRPVDIPAADALVPVDFSASEQIPAAGFRELYIVTSETLPVIAICGLFESTDNSRSSKRPILSGKLSFQEIVEDFKPKPVKHQPLRVKESEISDVKLFVADSLEELVDKTEGRMFSQPAVMDFVARPEAGLRYALVIGEGAVAYDNYRSPLSYLSLGFSFDRLQSRLGDLV